MRVHAGMSTVTTHSGCALDYPDVALAYGEARGLRLVLANVLDDDDAGSAVLDELGDCVECLRNINQYLAGMAGSIAVSLAEKLGGDQSDSIRQLQSMLAAAEAKL